MSEEFMAEFIGADTSWKGWIKQEGDKYYVLTKKWGLFNSWRLLSPYLADRLTKNFDEVFLYSIDQGVLSQKIKRYWWDLSNLKTNYPKTNVSVLRELESNKVAMRVQKDSLNDVKNLLYDDNDLPRSLGRMYSLKKSLMEKLRYGGGSDGDKEQPKR